MLDRVRNPGLAATLLTLAVAAPARAAGPELAFAELLLPGNTGIQFQTRLLGAVPADGVDLRRATWAHAGGAWLYVDSGQARWERVAGFPTLRYAAYVKTDADPDRLAAWDVLGEPRGVFEDQIAEVAFELRDPGPGGTVSKGLLKLKVGSSQPPVDALVLDRPALEIPLSGGATSVMLKARHPGVGLFIRRMRVDAVDSVWNSPPRFVGPNEVEVFEGKSVVVDLETSPSLPTALEWVLKGGAGQQNPRLLAQFDFSTQLFDDRPRTQEIEIPFRFVPSLFHVALALALGALLGSGLRVALARQGARGALRSVLVGLLGALVLGFIGGLLVTHNSRFVILGFDLNPLELLPAIVLGILSGFAADRVLVAAGLLEKEG